MSKPGDQVSAAGSSPSGPARQHQSHPEETEEELREHQGLSSSSSSSSCTSAQESGPLRGLVIKQEPPDPQEQEEREQRERQAEKDFLFRQVRIQSKRKKKMERSRPGGHLAEEFTPLFKKSILQPGTCKFHPLRLSHRVCNRGCLSNIIWSDYTFLWSECDDNLKLRLDTF